MNALQTIDEREVLGKQFRIYGTYDDPLFLAKDVAEWIEYSDPSMMLVPIDDGEKLIQTIFVSGQNRDCWFVTEEGLYELLMLSRKPIAKEFKSKVKEVLRDIRKHGMYMTDDLLADPEHLLQVTKAYVEAKQSLQKAELRLEHQKPLVTFAEQCMASPDCLHVRNVAKLACKDGIEIGEKRLWEKLREWKLIMKKPKTEPYQEYLDRGYFEIKEGSFGIGEQSAIYFTTMVTLRGQMYIINRLRKEMLLDA